MPERKSRNAYGELQERDLYILTEFFKMLGDPTRIHLLFLLMEQDACVSDLANRLGSLAFSDIFDSSFSGRAGDIWPGAVWPRDLYKKTQRVPLRLFVPGIAACGNGWGQC